MQIFVDFPPTDSNPIDPVTGMEKVILIEMQGALELDDGTDVKDDSHTATPGDIRHEQRAMQILAGQDLGKLERDGEKYYLNVGNHRLQGKKVALKKPIAVLRRIPAAPTPETTVEVSCVERARRLPETLDSVCSCDKNPRKRKRTLDAMEGSEKEAGVGGMVSAAPDSPESTTASGEREAGGRAPAETAKLPVRRRMEAMTILKFKYVFNQRPTVVLSEENKGLTAFAGQKR
ncbi:hypothetical protein HDU96_002961 [Phlyctochytrium bullatum]|nr:hypothetical protein HDU96_002961 [Phlyctochytrium bullatum]